MASSIKTSRRGSATEDDLVPRFIHIYVFVKAFLFLKIFYLQAMILFSHKSNPSQSSPDVSGASDLRGEEKEGQYLMVVHTSKPSRGLVPAVLPPASFTKVGSQSEMWMSSRVFTPFRFSKGLATKPTARTPPSHRLHFLPRRGQLLPPAKVCPPLSETQSGHGVRTSLMTRHV